MKLIYLVLAILFCFGRTKAQVNIDSHLHVIDTTISDDTKLGNYITLIKVFKFKDLEKVKEYSLAIYKLRKTTNPAYTKAMADYYLAYYYHLKGNQSEAILLFELVAQYGIDNEDFSFESSAKNNIATIYQEQGKYSEATEIYQNLITRHLDKDEEVLTIYPVNNLGLLNERIGEKEKALQYYKRSYQLAVKYKNDYQINLGAGNVANMYIKQSKLDSAKVYAAICRKVAVRENFSTSIAFADNLFGEIYLKEKQYSKALQYTRSATAAFDSLNQEVLYMSAANILTEVYYELSEYELALQQGEELFLRAKATNNLTGMKNAKRQLSRIYEKQGDIKKAYDLFVEAEIYDDSIFSKEKAESLYQIETKFETAKKDAEISEQKLQIEKQQSTRNYLIGGIIGIGLLSFLFFNRFRYRQRLTRQELLLKQEKIDNLEQKQKLSAMDYVLHGQEEERARIAKDLHDGLGGLLATARIQLQHLAKGENGQINQTSAAQAEEIINSAYAEVRRISHDMMPSALSNLGLLAAIEDLADGINTTGRLKVITQFYVDEGSISDQLEIALFRIIQEALNNTIKHASAKEFIIQITENPDSIHLTVEDDGVGFDKQITETTKGHGLRNIASRVKALGGTLNLETKPLEGLSLDIIIPKSLQ